MKTWIHLLTFCILFSCASVKAADPAKLRLVDLEILHRESVDRSRAFDPPARKAAHELIAFIGKTSWNHVRRAIYTGSRQGGGAGRQWP